MARFEEQRYQKALDIIKKGLTSQNQPLVKSFNEVGEEMLGLLGVEFKNTYNTELWLRLKARYFTNDRKITDSIDAGFLRMPGHVARKETGVISLRISKVSEVLEPL